MFTHMNNYNYWAAAIGLQWSCPGLNPHTIELVFHLVLKRVARCSINVVLAMLWDSIHVFSVICWTE